MNLPGGPVVPCHSPGRGWQTWLVRASPHLAPTLDIAVTCYRLSQSPD